MAAAAANIVLWSAFLVRGALGEFGAHWPGYLIVGAMMLLSVLAGWCSLRGKAVLLAIVFLVSFFPVGLYLLLTPSIESVIGVVDLLYLLGAIGLYRAR